MKLIYSIYSIVNTGKQIFTIRSIQILQRGAVRMSKSGSFSRARKTRYKNWTSKSSPP